MVTKIALMNLAKTRFELSLISVGKIWCWRAGWRSAGASSGQAGLVAPQFHSMSQTEKHQRNKHNKDWTVPFLVFFFLPVLFLLLFLALCPFFAFFCLLFLLFFVLTKTHSKEPDAWTTSHPLWLQMTDNQPRICKPTESDPQYPTCLHS